ncbi:MarR family winged helix-turn-helix transcriptional regulator [Rhizobium sp. S152]|uniref:MarR family winged helix-turn-helix transcriptional regulator n=1 Tax=Rhizobium sp. S152 TaxID=3055038 RepID=UPI0025AA00B6|nr:MarR family winged helix-turn-helix transcriptional regulator [Rhizobium sp. S152]MDM9624371.1 MarR family winged helix-turn-helix transcriptional regulator [Rhizobium sp. S152]
MSDIVKTAPEPAASTDDIMHIGQSMSRMRMITGRRLIARLAIAKVAPDLELSHLDVLDAVSRCAEQGEVTVGAIAEAMRIDPSRASRIVADMVGRDVLQRAASQQDARRIVVMVTPYGRRLLDELKAQKLAIIKDVVSDWSAEDAEAFARLFDKFMTGFERVFAVRDKNLPPAPSLSK